MGSALSFWEPSSPPSFEITIKSLFQSTKVPVNAIRFTDRFGTEHSLEKEAEWTAPLGKRLCIVDIDTRSLDDGGQIFDPNGLNWRDMHYTSAGMMNHYIYGEMVILLLEWDGVDTAASIDSWLHLQVYPYRAFS